MDCAQPALSPLIKCDERNASITLHIRRSVLWKISQK
jgi:hypothetical protein